MIFRLEYKDKALRQARLDIITPNGSGVETLEGTGFPFQLKYEGDKKDKSLYFLSSSADINIYETPSFNIDTLKTSGEKDIKVNYYINQNLNWTGYVIPDFFSREIGGDGVVSMVASDRLSVLESEVLTGLPEQISLRELLIQSLAKTGLTLNLRTVIDFYIPPLNSNILNYLVRSQRFTDKKGRSVNCHDIIKSILVATNSKIMQRNGEWWVINKMQHEIGTGRAHTNSSSFVNYIETLLSFSEVTRGAMRTIAPVAREVGIFQEYGGGIDYPENGDFSNGLTGWQTENNFVASTDDRRILGFTKTGNTYTPIYDAPGTSLPYLVNYNDNRIDFSPLKKKSIRHNIPVIQNSISSTQANITINATGAAFDNSGLIYVIRLNRPGRDPLFYNKKNEWEKSAKERATAFNEDPSGVSDLNISFSANIFGEDDGQGGGDDVSTYSLDIFILGSLIQFLTPGGVVTVVNTPVFINFLSVTFSPVSSDAPKGTIYKGEQGDEAFTKKQDTETTVFGDYMTGGLNGYFYNYAPDDTSSLLTPTGARTQPAWVNDYTQEIAQMPLLQHSVRQMRRMFSVAHDIIKGEIDVTQFDPLAIMQDCDNRRYVIIEAEYDFLRGSLQATLQEIAYENRTVREYIYSYFGEGDESVSGISGISSGGTGGGGGSSMAPEPSWLEDYIEINQDSGYLGVENWHVKNDLIIEGQVNQWLAQQLVVDDARIQVNRKQDGALAESGLVIFDKDTSTEVSRLIYDINGIWKAGGHRIFTEDYNPRLGGLLATEYATKNWVETAATAYNSARLGGVLASDYPRKSQNETVTGAWTFNSPLTTINNTCFVSPSIRIRNANGIGVIENLGDGAMLLYGGRLNNIQNLILGMNYTDKVGVFTNTTPLEKFHVNANSLFTGNALITGSVTAGGNVGTSNFQSQIQGWRVTAAGFADFRHIYTDELQAKAFTADISQALVGSDILTKSVAKLAQNWNTTANGVVSTIYVEELEGFPGYQVFSVNDRLRLRVFDRSGGGLLIKDIWATVTTYVSTTNNVQRYTITVNSGGITGQTVYAGSMVLDYGTPGSGVIERTVLDQQGSPYSQVRTWTGDPYTPGNFQLHYRSGNLDGIANAEGWGMWSQNTFLTGKLLVGDLTKQGAYMEYEAGVLTVKGRVEAIEGDLGGWLIVENSLNSVINIPNTSTPRMAINSTTRAITIRPSTSEFVRMHYATENFFGIEHFKQGNYTFQLGSTNQIANFEFGDGALGHKAPGTEHRFIVMSNNASSNAIISDTNSFLRRGFGYFAYDATIGNDGTKAVRVGLLTDGATTAYGVPKHGFQIIQRINAVNKEIFRVDEDGASISNMRFNDAEMWGVFPGLENTFAESPARLRLSSVDSTLAAQPFLEIGFKQISGGNSINGQAHTRVGMGDVSINRGTGSFFWQEMIKFDENGIRANYYSSQLNQGAFSYNEITGQRIRFWAASGIRMNVEWLSNTLRLTLNNLPTSSTGISGQVWRDGTTLRIVQ